MFPAHHQRKWHKRDTDSPIFPVHSHVSAKCVRKRERERDSVSERDDIELLFWGYVQILRNYHRRCIRLSTHGIEFIWTVLHAVHSIQGNNNNFVYWLMCKNKMCIDISFVNKCFRCFVATQ